MVIYADILILLNIIIDYFLIRAAGRITQAAVKPIRVIAAAVLGGISCLYIFINIPYKAVDFIYKISVCALMAAIAFKSGSKKRFLKNFGVLMAVTFLFSGAMAAVYAGFTPKNMAYSSMIVYFGISPAVLIISSVIGYFAVALFERIFGDKFKSAQTAEIFFENSGKTLKTTALIDSGNAISDIMGISEVVIVDKSVAAGIFGDLSDETALRSRYRAVPSYTVSGTELLDGYRCDRATVDLGNRKKELIRPILAISKTAVKDHGAILNPKSVL